MHTDINNLRNKIILKASDKTQIILSQYYMKPIENRQFMILYETT